MNSVDTNCKIQPHLKVSQQRHREMPTALVTIGSTLFDDLISVFEPGGAVFKALEDAHFERLIIQYGKGSSPRRSTGSKLKVEAFPFSDEIDKLIAHSDLVISHAGEQSPALRRNSEV